MDYWRIIKESLAVAWRYKILWLFGVFAGYVGGGGFNAGSNFSGSDSGSRIGEELPAGFPSPRELAGQAGAFIESYLIYIILGVLFIVALVVVFTVLRWLARPALIHLGAKGRAGEDVTFSEGWRAGFRFLVRSVLMGWMLWTPLVILNFLVMGGLLLFAYQQLMITDSYLSLIAPGLMLAGYLFVLALLTVPLKVFTLIATRTLVLGDEPSATWAIREAWGITQRKWKTFALVWVISIAVGMAVGFALVVVLFAFVVIMVLPVVISLAVAAKSTGFGAVLVVLTGLLFFVGMSVVVAFQGMLGSFVSNYWTFAYQDAVAERKPVAAQPSPA